MAKRQAVVANIHELGIGQMKTAKVGDTSIVLLRSADGYHALDGTCPHLGGPLGEGVLSAERLVCPWHHAGFCACTGELVNPPALDGVPQYYVHVHGEDIIVTIPEPAPAAPALAPRQPGADKRVFVILGSGAAGSVAAETLRQEGFQGEIFMITGDRMLPYDRTVLSKSFMASADPQGYLPIRDAAFYQHHSITVLTDRDVLRVDTAKRLVHFANGDSMHYDKLLAATGSTPRRLDVPGAKQPNVFTLRTPDDASRILASLEPECRALVVGASFIGLECASSLRARGVTVSLVAPDQVPLANIFGPEVGQRFLHQHRANGVELHLGKRVDHFCGTNAVQQACLDDGTRLEVDLVIVGIGVTPNTSIFADLPRSPCGGLPVGADMAVEQGGGSVFAAGDIAAFPLWNTGTQARIEHWRVAQQQGRLAARTMLDKPDLYREIPFFWTRQYNESIVYLGYAPQWDEVLLDGDPSAGAFLAYYVCQGQIHAVAGAEHKAELAAIEECMRRNRMPAVAELRGGSRIDWLARL